MKLSERKRKILQYVVDDYITTAQPVSSKSITEKYMQDLENLKFAKPFIRETTFDLKKSMFFLITRSAIFFVSAGDSFFCSCIANSFLFHCMHKQIENAIKK